MKTRIAVFILVLLTLFGTASFSPAPTRPIIHILMVDVPEQLAPFKSFFLEEVDRDFAQLGVQSIIIPVRRTDPANGVTPREVVIFFQPNPPPIAPKLLGVSQNDNQKRLVMIFTGGLLNMLGVEGELTSIDPTTKRDVVRGLAKVVVHESIHSILPMLGHTKDGLMSSKATIHILLDSQVRVDEDVRRWLLMELEMEERFKDTE